MTRWLGISNEEVEAWARKICFSIDVRSNHFVQIGIRTLARERILGTLNQRRKRFCRGISPFLKTVITISFESIHIGGTSYEIIRWWRWSEGGGLGIEYKVEIGWRRVIYLFGDDCYFGKRLSNSALTHSCEANSKANVAKREIYWTVGIYVRIIIISTMLLVRMQRWLWTYFISRGKWEDGIK